MQRSPLSSRAFGDCLWPSLSLVGKKDKVCCQSWLLDSEWVLQRHPVRDCSHCLACTVGLFLQVRCSWAQSPSRDCCRLLTGDDGLPPSLLLLILLVWQDVACEYTFDSKLGHKIHKEHPIEHHCHKNKQFKNFSPPWQHKASVVRDGCKTFRTTGPSSVTEVTEEGPVVRSVTEEGPVVRNVLQPSRTIINIIIILGFPNKEKVSPWSRGFPQTVTRVLKLSYCACEMVLFKVNLCE